MAQAKRVTHWLRRLGLRWQSVGLSLLLGAMGLALCGCPCTVMYGPAPEYGAQPLYGVPAVKAAVEQPAAPAMEAARQEDELTMQ